MHRDRLQMGKRIQSVVNQATQPENEEDDDEDDEEAVT